MSFAKEVWETLSNIDCSKMVEKKGRLSYLSWASAWSTLMNNYPESEYRFDELVRLPDATCEIWVYVTIKEGEKSLERFIWLPVLDHQNRPIREPNAFQINTSRMRCLTKCLAMCGLGIHIYKGEDVPNPDLDKPPATRGTSAVAAALEGVKIDESQREDYVHSIEASMYNEDESGLRELLDELKTDNDMKLAVWQKLNSQTRSYIKKLEKGE